MNWDDQAKQDHESYQQWLATLTEEQRLLALMMLLTGVEVDFKQAGKVCDKDGNEHTGWMHTF